MDDRRFRVTLTRRQAYEFLATFGEDDRQLLLDEPAPLGGGHGPNATRVLGAAVGHCLAASLLFCLGKARVDVGDLGVTVDGTVARNDAGRLRITDLKVTLAPSVRPADRDRLGRCRELFEDFCIVTQSVRTGLTVHVDVAPSDRL
ncbi:MAG: OsmC family protein [Gemmatimonadota bacterium]|nr:OsmC family protein [Gemmatimonadota bacterium]